MSDPTTSRPRPKPRPRLPSSKQPSDSLASVPIDSDDLFVVNRGRTKETWRKLEALNKDTSRHSSDAESHDGGESISPRKRQKTDGAPRWKRDQQALQMLSVESSDSDGSDSDSDIEIIDRTTRKGKGKGVALPSKGERCSKSRSITPPPEVPAAVLENARNLIRRAVELKRASSPTVYEDDFDASTDTIVLDPELERIAEAVKAQSIRNLKTGEGEKLSVKVKWQKHPLSPAEPELVLSYKIPRDESFRNLFDSVARDIRIHVSILVLTHKNKRLFASATPDALGLWGEAEFVGCHSGTYEYLQKEARDKRQTPSPAKERPPHHPVSENTNFINILSDDEDSDDEAFSNQLNNQPDTQPSSPRKSSPPQPQASQESEAESDDGGKFKLVLRSDKSAKDIALIVRPTTKCGSIVKAYIKKIGLTDLYPHIFDENGSASAPAAPPTTTRGRGGRGRGGRGRGRGRGKAKVQAETPNVPLSDPRITVDGDRMENDAEIGDADLEDGDMVDVVGL
ncbi:hypothetical protein AGABI1DRAFT_128422 [Agaricus bisporus var. burnettii JB137-S8]|uniref:Ubiquitin-like domain-containing protein n=1 Tax=Agaricus bisporus var. burnettii (strain JB137-S8 / ATCC MYA-4627 / FGSC 10392) TaxID=597362 RepID=K5XVR2_AGABU|nr:uncharacterized protein AGABI1DRAFT_128422 [Agaricus bisporus var. burnettii JB137-S8]EKM79265.1 hypothetical protein AGABI1DRAFT_128422 [Agaricus bisporus var. burnettii JB137-S8]